MTARAAVASLLSLVLALLPAGEAAAHMGPHGVAPRKTAVAATAGPAAALPKTATAPGAAPQAGAAAAKPGEVVQAVPALSPAVGLSATAISAEPGTGAEEQAAAAIAAVDGRLVFDGEKVRRTTLAQKLTRWSGLHAMADLAREGFVSRRVDTLLDKSLPAEKRVRAAMALAHWQRTDAAAALSTAAHDPDRLVSRAARLALARLGVKPAAGLYEAPEYEFEDAKRPVRMAALKKVIVVALAAAAVEGAGAALTGASSLLADAMHIAADLTINLGVLYALWAAGHRPDHKKTYGSLKLEPMVGFISSMLIPALAVYAGFQAWERFLDPAGMSVWAAGFAAFGLASNAFGAWVISRLDDNSVSMRTALIHFGGDAAGSASIMLGAFATALFGWTLVDPIVTLGIIALIMHTSWGILRESWHMLMDGVPAHIDLNALAWKLAEIPGVAKVHDVHVWQGNSSLILGTGKLNAVPGADLEAIRVAAKAVFAAHGAAHVTVEVRAAAN